MTGDATHEWFTPPTAKWEACRRCGIVRRTDRQNKPCKGDVFVTLRDALAPVGFIVANSNHDKFRTWEAEGPAWTTAKKDAVVFLRRADAEKVFAEDEDAWAILPVTASDL